MSDEILRRDQNFVTVLGGVTNDSDLDVKMLRVDPITKRLLVSASISGGFVSSINGLTGAVTLAQGTNITLTTVGNTITINADPIAIGDPVVSATTFNILYTNASGNLAQDSLIVWNDAQDKFAVGGSIVTSDGAFSSPASPASIKLSSSEDGDTLLHEPVITFTDNSGLNVQQWMMDSRTGMAGTVYFPAGAGTLALVADIAPIVAISTRNYIAQTSTYAITSTDYCIDCTSGTFTVTLPTAVGRTGKPYSVINSGSGTITLATTSSQTIGNISPTTTITINPGEVYNVISDGANWKLYA